MTRKSQEVFIQEIFIRVLYGGILFQPSSKTARYFPHSDYSFGVMTASQFLHRYCKIFSRRGVLKN